MASNNLRNFYKCFVGNIPWTVGTNELKHYFSKFGHIQSAVVVFNKNTGLSKSYGFVTFGNRDAYDNVLNAPAHKLEGNTLKIEPVTEQ